MSLDDNIERMVEEAEQDFHQIEEDLREAESLVSEIRKDLKESELETKKLMPPADGDGAIRPGADFDESTLRRDLSEIKKDVQRLHELMSDMNNATEKFAEMIGAWSGMEAFKPE